MKSLLKTNNIFLFIPNIIGYIRYLLMVITIFTYRQRPILTLVLIATSAILDAFDGMAARKYNQCTDFGAVLDMVCDRSSDAMFLGFLGALYPEYGIVFYGDILLDLTSHWYQMYASISTGEHHKQSKSKYKLLNIYYGSKLVLFTLCAGNSIFMLLCYLAYFQDKLGFTNAQFTILRFFIGISGVLFAVKKLMSVIQLMSASQKIAEKDAEKRKYKPL